MAGEVHLLVAWVGVPPPCGKAGGGPPSRGERERSPLLVVWVGVPYPLPCGMDGGRFSTLRRGGEPPPTLWLPVQTLVLYQVFIVWWRQRRREQGSAGGSGMLCCAQQGPVSLALFFTDAVAIHTLARRRPTSRSSGTRTLPCLSSF